MFTKILHDAGITEYEARMEILRGLVQDYRKGRPYAAVVAADYLQIKMGDANVAGKFEAALTKNGWQLALECARIFDEIIERENPQTQETAASAVQDCLNGVFRSGGPGLKHLP